MTLVRYGWRVTDTAPASAPATTIPAGWYPNPQNPAQQRWWDGTQWTEHVSAPAFGGAPAYAGAPAYGSAQQQLTAPEGTNWNTPWIWLVIALPLLSLIPAMFTDLSSTSATYTSTDLIVSLVNLAVSVLIAGGVITFAFLDFRELRRRGVPQPFHWAFAFFALLNLGVIYAIGRAVVVQRRTGKGGPVLIAAIVSIVIGVVVFITIVAISFGQMMQDLPGVY